MNYMQYLAEMLQLEWDTKEEESEVFEIGECTYKITKTRGLVRWQGTASGWGGLYFNLNKTLAELLIGKLEITRKEYNPVKPKFKEQYFKEAISKTEELLKMLKESEGE